MVLFHAFNAKGTATFTWEIMETSPNLRV